MKKAYLTLFATAVFWAWAGAPAASLASSPQDQDRPAAAPQDPDHDTTRPELANFDVFLDGHPEIARQLRHDPSLINHEDFVENHPELREYLQNHPNVREELKEHPNAFMTGERRFDRHESDRPDRDMTRGEVSNVDKFLDNHPNIDKQLSKNPSLINNEDYVENHPELQQFLKDHPGAREELKENPRVFMRSEHRLDAHDKDPHLRPDPDKR